MENSMNGNTYDARAQLLADLSDEDDMELEDLSDLDEDEEDGSDLETASEDQSRAESEARALTEAKELQVYASAAEKDTADVDLESDEERDILKNIKEEILRQVRDEMSSELAVYRHPPSTAGRSNDPSALPALDEIEDVEPRLKEAILRMRKLDKILLKKVKREREVKRDRMMLQRRLRDELDNLEHEGPRVTSDVKNNTLKFLALTPPPKHNEGIYLGDSPPDTPVFKTEYLGDDRASSGAPTNASNQNSSDNLTDDAKEKLGKRRRGRGTARERARQRRKDFIKRNIELASKASEVIAMTEDEKVRLDGLLDDLDAIPDQLEDDDVDLSNPFQVRATPGEGFSVSGEEQHRLEDINSRLRFLMPPEDYESMITPSVTSSAYQPSLFVRMQLEEGLDVESLGEAALREVKEDRDSKMRLETVNNTLEILKTDQKYEVVDPHLSRAQLDALLDICARSISRSSQLTSGRVSNLSEGTEACSEHSTAVSALLDDPPRLEDDVLRRLLDEARANGIGGPPPAMREMGRIEEEVDEDEEEMDTPTNTSLRESQNSLFKQSQGSPPPPNQSIASSRESSASSRLSNRSNTPILINQSSREGSAIFSARSRNSPSTLSSVNGFMSDDRQEENEAISPESVDHVTLPDISMYENMTAPRTPKTPSNK